VIAFHTWKTWILTNFMDGLLLLLQKYFAGIHWNLLCIFQWIFRTNFLCWLATYSIQLYVVKYYLLVCLFFWMRCHRKMGELIPSAVLSRTKTSLFFLLSVLEMGNFKLLSRSDSLHLHNCWVCRPDRPDRSHWRHVVFFNNCLFLHSSHRDF